MPTTIPVFLNGRSFLATPGTSLRSFLADHDPDLHRALGVGEALATDARGLPFDPDTLLSAGAIMKVARSARRTTEAPDA